MPSQKAKKTQHDLLRETLEQRFPEYLDILIDLVNIDTQVLGHGIEGGREKSGQNYLIDLFKSMQADHIATDAIDETVLEATLEKYNEGNLGHNNEDRFNVYATFRGQSPKSLMFNGHIDTMPPGDINLWTSHPHRAELRDGKLFGLGTADMKSGLLAGILATKLYQDSGLDLPITVKICSVVDEEGGGNGSIQAAYKGQKADGVIVCEPSDRELILANMAFLFFQVDVIGKSCHSGGKKDGVSAIEKAILLMDEIKELEHEWLLKYKHVLLPPPSQNFGVIEGGTAGSTVPDHCTFKTCVHYLPNDMKYEEVVTEYTGRIMSRAEADPWLKDHPPSISIYQAGGGFEIDPTAELPSKMLQAWHAANGTEMPIVGSPAGCDCRSWANIANCPVIQCGPGKLSDCHSIDESVEIQQFKEYILAFAFLIGSWA